MRFITLIFVCTGMLGSAKIIQADADESYMAKVHAGASQAFQWMGEWVAGTGKPPRPPKKVQLALVGFGRTGSTSLSAALKVLDYTPIHDDEGMEVADIYGAMIKGTMPMDEINVELGKRGFDAPMVSVHKYVEWAAQAPDVKVLLSLRDKEKWAQSWLAVTPSAFLAEERPFKWIKAMTDMAPFIRETMLNVPTNGHPELYQDVPTLLAGWDAWVAFVRKTVPKEKLLEFDVKDGWGPLCEFVGKPVPSIPFPHINDRIVVDTIVKVLVLITWIWPLVFASPLLVLFCCIRCCCRRDVSGAKKKD